MRCGNCGLVVEVDWHWLEKWSQSIEACPRCGTNAEPETCARPYVYETDPALDDNELKSMFWYHTTDCGNWPDPNFNPLGTLTDTTIRRMGGEKQARRWALRQQHKALHLGTYEAAVHNMYRRIENQGDAGKNFYLYRIVLHPNAQVRPGWYPEASNFVGDVPLDEVCPAPYTVTRYLNIHEDPGSLSLAIRPEAIASTQSLSLNSILLNEDEVDTLVSRLGEALKCPPLPERYIGKIRVRHNRSPVAAEAAAIAKEISEGLPIPFRDSLRAPQVEKPEEFRPFAHWILAVQALALNHVEVLSTLNNTTWRAPSSQRSGQYLV